MQNLPQQQKTNPLANLMRQPKLTIKLPSQGRFWPSGSINLTADGEYKVFSMTAKDELLLKNPATQSGGQALVDVIQSCIPDIRNAWDTPGIDLDTILIAIRIATYGTAMTVPAKVGYIEENYEVDLTNILNSVLANVSWNEQFALENGMIIFLSPLRYKDIAKAGQENIETQKIMNIVNDEKMDDEKKVELFRDSFIKLTDITLSVVIGSVTKIITDDGTIVDNPKFIKEFMENVDRDVFTKIRLRINELTLENSIKPVKVAATPEMITAGSESMIDVDVSFSPDTFFK